MERNQLASEIAAEYEAMGIKSANEHFHLKQIHPFAEFPALAAHVSFCTLMQLYWKEIQEKLNDGPEMYETKDDVDNHNSEWGLM
jgi:hypothetical protein